MPARRRTLAAIAAVLAATGTVLTVGTAEAAPAGAASNITMTVGRPTPAGSLTPGGAAESFTVTAANNTATAQEFTSEAGGSTTGAIPLNTAAVAFQATAIGATPATGGSLNSEDGELLGAFYPAGGHFGDSFSIPAHTTYSWRLSLAATKAWPLNDADLKFFVEGNSATVAPVFTTFEVGDGTTGGPTTQTFDGAGIVAPGQPAYEHLTVTNHTGAALGQDWTDHLDFSSVDPTGVQTFFNEVTLQASVWNGTAYAPVPADGVLPALSKDLAPGASTVYRIRVDLVKYSATTEGGELRLNAGDETGNPADGTSTVLTLHRDPQTGPSASPTASAPASASPAPTARTSSSASAAPVATAAPTAPSAAPTDGAALAETGGGSGSGLLAGIGFALLAAGSAIAFLARRRTTRG